MKLVCRIRGHRWNAMSLACGRCHVTHEQMVRGRRIPEVEKAESEAYWRGVTEGRKIDRRRAYRLGYMRGGRDVFARVQRIVGHPQP